jgi:hypothetical protein
MTDVRFDILKWEGRIDIIGVIVWMRFENIVLELSFLLLEQVPPLVFVKWLDLVLGLGLLFLLFRILFFRRLLVLFSWLFL